MRAARLFKEVQQMFQAADHEGRPLTAEERVYAEGLLEEAEQTAEMEKNIDRIGRMIGPAGGDLIGGPSRLESLTNPYGQQPTGGPGDRFVNSEAYKGLFGTSASRGERWSTGLIEVTDGPPWMQTKGTLGEGGGAFGIGGGAFTSIPQLVPGVVDKLFPPLTIEQLLLGAQANAPTIRTLVEGTATSGAGGVAEGGTKPESTLGLTTVDEPVKKIATFLPVSDELLEDGPSIQAYINSRLSAFVQLEVDRQLYRGAGGNELVGLFNRSAPIYSYVTGTADNKAVQLFKALNSMRGSQLIEPEWICMHPSDYQTLRLLTDNSGQLMGGGPFLGPYGGAGPVGASGQITGATDVVWSKPTIVTASMGGPGTALIGTSANAQVWARGGLSVEASNSHQNFFQLDLVAVRAERRLGLTVFRTGGYLEVRFGTAASIA